MTHSQRMKEVWKKRKAKKVKLKNEHVTLKEAVDGMAAASRPGLRANETPATIARVIAQHANEKAEATTAQAPHSPIAELFAGINFRRPSDRHQAIGRVSDFLSVAIKTEASRIYEDKYRMQRDHAREVTALRAALFTSMQRHFQDLTDRAAGNGKQYDAAVRERDN